MGVALEMLFIDYKCIWVNRMFVCLLFLFVYRLEVTIEPIFAAVALYDAKERRKISETFYIDINQNSISKMLDHLTPKDASIATAARSGIFNITYPHSDVFLVIRVSQK